MHVLTCARERQEKQRLLQKRGHGAGTNSVAETEGLKVLNLNEVLMHHYQHYRLPRFDEDPNVFEGLSVFSRRSPEELQEMEEG